MGDGQLNKYLGAVGLALVIACLSMAAWCDKTTQDPNAPGAKKPVVKPRTDPRLEKKVTYQGGYKRLSAIADELTVETSIAIRSGSSPKDWQVRDIPMVVAVKDVPLGKLLDAIAAAAHVKLVPEKIGSGGWESVSYRFTRSKAMREGIEGRIDVIRDANRELASWAWDALVAYANKPEAQLKVKNEHQFFQIDSEQIRLVARILSVLGDEAKQRAFSGEQVTLTYNSFPDKDLLRRTCNYAAGHPRFGMHGQMNATEPLTPTEDEIKRSLVIAKMTPLDEPDERRGFNLLLYGVPVATGPGEEQFRFADTWQVSPIELADALVDNKVPGIPPKPDLESKFRPTDEFPLEDFSNLASDADWEKPTLQQKLTLGLPRTRTGPTSGEALVELARKSGLDIVSEDFTSHRDLSMARPRLETEKETTAADVLRNVEYRMLGERKWFIDPGNRLLCGWADDWRMRHRSLVPESMLVALREKRRTTGAELDDLVPFFALSDGQLSDWVFATRDYIFFGNRDHGEHVPWLLYGSLSDEARVVARSATGLPLAGLDLSTVSAVLSKGLDEYEARNTHMSPPEETARRPNWLSTVASPDKLAHLSLKVTPVPMDRWFSLMSDDYGLIRRELMPAGPSVTKHAYRLEIFGELDEQHFSRSVTWDNPPFPYFTIEREAELGVPVARDTDE